MVWDFCQHADILKETNNQYKLKFNRLFLIKYWVFFLKFAGWVIQYKNKQQFCLLFASALSHVSFHFLTLLPSASNWEPARNSDLKNTYWWPLTPLELLQYLSFKNCPWLGCHEDRVGEKLRGRRDADAEPQHWFFCTELDAHRFPCSPRGMHLTASGGSEARGVKPALHSSTN